MITTIAIVLLSISCILLARGVYKLQKRVEVLHKETNNRIYLTDKLNNQRLQEEIEELIDIIKTNASNSDRLREEGLKELKDEIQKLIPPTNKELMDRIETMEKESYRLRMNM